MLLIVQGKIMKYLTPKFSYSTSSVKLSMTQLSKSQAESVLLSETNLETGVFKTLPTVYDGPTHFKRAMRAAKLIKADMSIANLRKRNRKLAAETIDAVMKALTKPITNILNTYITLLHDLHPYEAAVADLTIIARIKAGHPSLKIVLENLRKLRMMTSKTAKEYAATANICTTSIEAKDLLKQSLEELQLIYEASPEATALGDLIEIQKDLRRIPVIDLELPTVVLVGAPNVGKSSIVRAVSTGTPEVNDYPFTTRGVTIGHILNPKPSVSIDNLLFDTSISSDISNNDDDNNRNSKKINKINLNDIKFQVMDTPGLLDRPDEERNEMERLTFASLAHLPTAVLFVIDPTGLSGEKSTLEAQLNVRSYLKSRFPKRPWLDVISKGDIEVSEEIQKILPSNHILVSVQSGKNIDILKSEIENMLFRLQSMLTTTSDE